MLKEGQMIYFEENGQLYEGRCIHVTKDTFEIENYGCCCEGGCVIDQSMIGYTFFRTKEEVLRRIEAGL